MTDAALATKAPPCLNSGTLALGLHIGLPETEHHADPALGSSDLKSLKRSPAGYWHGSWMNPKRPKEKDTDTPSRVMGRAIHKMLLEGPTAFASTFVRRPDDPPDATPAEKGALTKKANRDLLEGQHLLPGADYDFVLGANEIIEAHPDLAGVLKGAITECTFVWEVEYPEAKIGKRALPACRVRFKARFDALKSRGIGDIKSCDPEGLSLETAARNQIARYRYDIQVASYLAGREVLRDDLKKFGVSGTVHWHGDPGMAHMDHCGRLLDLLAQREECGFQIIFVPKTGAPDAWSCTLSPGNPILDYANNHVTEAVTNLRLSFAEFGAKRWTSVRPVAELAMEEMPAWYGRD